ncbi:hypothetical protein [Actinomadura sp. GTD37]|uniref:aromatic-ring hydroxylase C-terminal domain-containing protein n=1 Tax=Actinomadura sp. GTD37 TaxID=1778030 RepID=UPI0035BEB86F
MRQTDPTQRGQAGPRGDVPASAMLVRPDGHVCWTSALPDLEETLGSWFGAPNSTLP